MAAALKRPHRTWPAAARMHDIDADAVHCSGEIQDLSDSERGGDNDDDDDDDDDDDNGDELAHDDQDEDEKIAEEESYEEIDDANDSDGENQDAENDEDESAASARSSGEDARSVAAAADAIDEATRAAQEQPFESLQELASYLNADTESFVVTGALHDVSAQYFCLIMRTRQQ